MRDQLSVRLPRELNEAVGERAKRDSRRPSDVVRLALQQYLLGCSRRRAQRSGPRPRDRCCAVGRVRGPQARSQTIVLRDVPEDLYQALEKRAAHRAPVRGRLRAGHTGPQAVPGAPASASPRRAQRVGRPSSSAKVGDSR